jgi:tetratricopeptide (TPR) repeat protein
MQSMTTRTAALHRVAGDQAANETRWDEAVREYEAALSLVAAGEVGDDASSHDDASSLDEVALLTALGMCYWNLAEARTAWRTLRRAIALARERGDGVAMARATVEILRIWGPPERHREMADDALGLLGGDDPYLRALLLLRKSRYSERDDPGFAEALAIAEEHGFEDVLAVATDREGWVAIEAGRIDEGISYAQVAHETYARLRVYEFAAGALRGVGFAVMERGDLDKGGALAAQSLAYARSVHLRFNEQLALMDLAGEAFARADYKRSRELIAQTPGELDFRCDLYKVWMTELAGDIDGAVRHVINPERGGGAPTAISQTHGGNAGILFHAGRIDSARRELEAWLEVARQGESFCEEIAAVADCLVELGSEEVLREVHSALDRDAALPAPTLYCTLQGRALAPARGAVALRLGFVDRAEVAYQDGLAWCERERVPIDAGQCHAGLADVARARGDEGSAAEHLAQAASIFKEHDARLWLERLPGQ